MPSAGGPAAVPAGPAGPPPNTSPAPVENRLSHFSPHAGLVFQPVPDVSLYFGYAESFQFLPTGNFNTLQLLLPGASNEPTHGRQYESGVKLDVFGNRLQTTLAYFFLTKDGLPNSRIAGAPQTEKETSKGVELDIAGQITPDWNVIVAHAYDNAHETLGLPILNAPLHSGNIWTTYRFQDGVLRPFLFGGGVNHVDSRLDNPLNGFRLPPYTRVDAMAAFQVRDDHWRLQVNVKDLTNRTYYQTDALFTLVFPYARAVQASLTYQY
jgi:iron complex outermembrane receptor protein